MKLNFKNIMIFAFVLVVLFGCGIQQIAEDTKKETQKANEGMAISNQTSLAILTLQNEMLVVMKRMNELMAVMNQISEDIKNGVDKTNEYTKAMLEYMRLQAVGIGMEGMLNAHNTANLVPPTMMIPYAKTFSEKANEQEFIQFAYNLYGAAMYSSTSINDKKIYLTALGLMGGFLTLEQFTTHLTHQVDESGQYIDATYGLAMVRYMTLRDLMLNPYLTSDTLTVPALEDAVNQYNGLVHIVNLSYVNKIKIFINLFANYQASYSEVKNLGISLNNRFKLKLSPSAQSAPQVQALLSQLLIP